MDINTLQRVGLNESYNFSFDNVAPTPAMVVRHCSCCVTWAERAFGYNMIDTEVEIIGAANSNGQSAHKIDGPMNLVVRVVGKPRIQSMPGFVRDKNYMSHGYMAMCSKSLDLLSRCIME